MPWQRATAIAKRTTATKRAKAKKPKDTRVKHGGHTHRTVNAPKGAW